MRFPNGVPEISLTSELDTGALLRIIFDIESAIRSKIIGPQSGVPTFFDNVVLSGIRMIRDQHSGVPASAGDRDDATGLLLRYAEFKSRPRFSRYSDRSSETAAWVPLPWEPSPLQLEATQGVEDCLSWRGLPLFKSVYDFAIYPMLLWDLKPATIFELGSGTGASAFWYSDIMRMFEFPTHIYSIDLNKLSSDDPQVSFLQGDCRELESVLPFGSLDDLPHPWLVIEDMHVNTAGILSYFAIQTTKRDYIVVEDSRSKSDDLAAFDRQYSHLFRVDTRYTDFFGRNATCSADSIFVHV
jgi:Rhamnosyl O-methyltransferase/CmcI